MAYLDSRYLDKRWRRYATGEVLKCCTGCTETYKKSSPRALIDLTYGSPRIPDTSEPSSMRNRNVSWSKSRTLSFSMAGINITVPAWICCSSSSLYPKSWSSVRPLSCILLSINESRKTLLDPGISIFQKLWATGMKETIKINLIKMSLNFLSLLQIQRSHEDKPHVETVQTQSLTFFSNQSEDQSSKLLKLDSGKEKIRSPHQSKSQNTKSSQKRSHLLKVETTLEELAETAVPWAAE